MQSVQSFRFRTAAEAVLVAAALVVASDGVPSVQAAEPAPSYVTFSETPDVVSLATALGLRHLGYAVVAPGGDRLDRPAFGKPKKPGATATPARTQVTKAKPAAPKKAPVKANVKNGSQPESWVTEIISFANGSGRIYSTEMGILDMLGVLMQQDEEFTLIVSGHANATGSHAINDKLSMERSMAVAAYLSRVYRIGPERFDLRWMGARDPLPGTHPADALNRRVQFGVLPPK